MSWFDRAVDAIKRLEKIEVPNDPRVHGYD